ncbi:MAG: ATP-binding cassette domain-containing protein, partial [Erysipelotrichales bacterium]
ENAFILVSHDIPFLNSVINVIYEIENCALTRYTGDYNQYLSMHEMKVAQQNAAYNKQQKEIDDLEDFIARNKARVATRNMASSRQKKLDKMTIITKTKEKIKPVFGFSEDRTPGRVIFETKDLVIGYDEPLSSPLNLVFERNKKIAIRGCNGLGKSTLLKSLFGIIPSISGSVELDPFVTLGYFKQEE